MNVPCGGGPMRSPTCGFSCMHTVVRPSPLSSSKIFYYPQRNPVPVSSHSPTPARPLIGFPCLWISLFWTLHRKVKMGSYKSAAFCVWLLLPCLMFSRFIYVVAWTHTLFFATNLPLFSCTPCCLSIQPLMGVWVFPPFTYCEWSCSGQHAWYLSLCFQLFEVHAQEWNGWVTRSFPV